MDWGHKALCYVLLEYNHLEIAKKLLWDTVHVDMNIGLIHSN